MSDFILGGSKITADGDYSHEIKRPLLLERKVMTNLLLLLLLLSRFSHVRSVRSERWQPTRLPRPWDSPGKNTGVGGYFLLQCMKAESEIESEVTQSFPTLPNPMDCSLPGSSVHRIFQTRVLEWGAIAFSNMLSRWVITFLPRSKRLLISCLQSTSPVILEPQKIKSLTVCR